MSYPVYHGTRLAGPRALQYVPFAACALALPLFAAAGWTLVGWAVGVVLFLANRASAILLDRLARGKMQVTAVGITGMGFISRAWITFGLLFAVAEFGSKTVAISAAISFLVYFTLDMLLRSILFVAAGSARKPELEESA
jgi:hypothetical protein